MSRTGLGLGLSWLLFPEEEEEKEEQEKVSEERVEAASGVE